MLDLLGVLIFMFVTPLVMKLMSQKLWWIGAIYLAVYVLVCACTFAYRESLCVMKGENVTPSDISPPLSTAVVAIPYGCFAAGVLVFYTGFPNGTEGLAEAVVGILTPFVAFLYAYCVYFPMHGRLEGAVDFPTARQSLVALLSLMQYLSMVCWLLIAEDASPQVYERLDYIIISFGWMMMLLVFHSFPRFYIHSVEGDKLGFFSYFLSTAIYAWLLVGKACGMNYLSL
ncbi:hypothetical protein KDL29_13995 [bacterium]|nr:hypothetical protein [bacterium]